MSRIRVRKKKELKARLIEEEDYYNQRIHEMHFDDDHSSTIIALLEWTLGLRDEYEPRNKIDGDYIPKKR